MKPESELGVTPQVDAVHNNLVISDEELNHKKVSVADKSESRVTILYRGGSN